MLYPMPVHVQREWTTQCSGCNLAKNRHARERGWTNYKPMVVYKQQDNPYFKWYTFGTNGFVRILHLGVLRYFDLLWRIDFDVNFIENVPNLQQPFLQYSGSGAHPIFVATEHCPEPDFVFVGLRELQQQTLTRLSLERGCLVNPPAVSEEQLLKDVRAFFFLRTPA